MYIPRFDGVRLAVEIAATAAFALSGLMEAARRKLDAVGTCAVAFLAAFGGGTLRDLLLDQRPFYWVRYPDMVWGVIALAVLAMFTLRSRHFAPTERLIRIPDAIGLGLFTAAGVDTAVTVGLPPLVCALMGMVTAVFGGVLRDIACGEVPSAFRDHRPYALIAFIGAWFQLGVLRAGLHGDAALVLVTAFTAGLRLVAVAKGWRLPAWKTDAGT